MLDNRLYKDCLIWEASFDFLSVNNPSSIYFIKSTVDGIAFVWSLCLSCFENEYSKFHFTY